MIIVDRELTIADCVLLKEIHHVDVSDSAFLLHQRVAVRDLTRTRSAWKLTKSTFKALKNNFKSPAYLKQISRERLAVGI